MIIKIIFQFIRLLSFFGLFLISISVLGQGNGNGSPIDNSQTLTVSSTGSLQFGRFSRLNGGNITISPNGNVVESGDIFLMNSLRSSVRFDITTNRGNSNLVNVTVFTTPLTGPGTLELSVILDQTSFIIDKNNPAIVNMGGTITIGSDDLPGIYTGSVSVIFVYE